MPDLVFLNYTSEHPLDQLDTTCLILPFFADERPIKGLSGYADWRMNGKISRDRQSNRVHGDLQEVVLVPSAHRLKPQNLLLFGLGSRKEFSKVNFFQALLRLTQLILKSKPQNFVYALHGQWPAMEQTSWLAEFVSQQENNIPVWNVLSQENQTDACVGGIQKQFPKLNIRTEHLVGEPGSKKPFTLR